MLRKTIELYLDKVVGMKWQNKQGAAILRLALPSDDP